jgi:hypothetical protein
MRGETPRWEPIIPNFSDPREARLVETRRPLHYLLELFGTFWIAPNNRVFR